MTFFLCVHESCRTCGGERRVSHLSECNSADSVDYRMLFCKMSSDSEESTISECSGDSSAQVDSAEEIEVVGHVERVL